MAHPRNRGPAPDPACICEQANGGPGLPTHPRNAHWHRCPVYNVPFGVLYAESLPRWAGR